MRTSLDAADCSSSRVQSTVVFYSIVISYHMIRQNCPAVAATQFILCLQMQTYLQHRVDGPVSDAKSWPSPGQHYEVGGTGEIAVDL